MPCFYSLKIHILKLIRPPERSIFGIYDAIGVRYLFQLRLGLSPLRHHKWKHNFSDTPSNKCMCNEDIENIKHFLFDCPFFTTQRIILMTNVREILENYNLEQRLNQPKLYLYGDTSINRADNKKILVLDT